jgi:GntR family transcriptional regulator, histidine utilization repressor
MTLPADDKRTGYLAVKRIVLDRIRTRRWLPDSIIPGEADIAAELGVSRATVNRALQDLASEGFLDRKRRAGTRVRPAPIRHARLEIPQVRQEIEALGQVYRYQLLERKTGPAPAWLNERLGLRGGEQVLFGLCQHFADGLVFQIEERWINLSAAPDIAAADLSVTSPSDWLVNHVPFTNAEFAFSAGIADAQHAERGLASKGAAIFIAERTTWLGETSITFARMSYRADYRMLTRI